MENLHSRLSEQFFPRNIERINRATRHVLLHICFIFFISLGEVSNDFTQIIQYYITATVVPVAS